MINGSVPHHLKVLGAMLTGNFGIIKGVRKTHPFDGRLGYTTYRCGRGDIQAIQHRGYEVYCMDILGSNSFFCEIPLIPVYDERVGYATPVGFRVSNAGMVYSQQKSSPMRSG